MPLRRHDDQAILGERQGLQLGRGVDGIGDDTDVGLSAGHGARDLGIRELLEIDIDGGMGGEECRKRNGQQLQGRGRVREQADMAAQALAVPAELAAHESSC
jgi:hypothetical protein